jgi:hypothetical protein
MLMQRNSVRESLCKFSETIAFHTVVRARQYCIAEASMRKDLSVIALRAFCCHPYGYQPQ